MKLAILIAGVFLAQGALAGELKIDWVNPDKFTDIYIVDESKVQALDTITKEFTHIFARLSKQLPPGYTLEVSVTDIDLAGVVRISSAAGLRRIISSTDYPAISFQYSLKDADKKVLESDSMDLVDSRFLSKRLMVSGPFGYEEQMLKAWFNAAILQKFGLEKK